MAHKRNGNGLPNRSPNALTGLEVEGFKSLRDATALEIRPLTILAGANSSGKSAAIQPLLLLKQTIEDSADRGPLKLDGPCVRFTDADQFFSRKRGNEFSVKLEFGGQSIKLTFSRKGKHDLAVQQKTVGADGHPVSLQEGMTSEEIAVEASAGGDISKHIKIGIKREACFLNLTYSLTSATVTPYRSSSSVAELVGKTRWALPRLIHVPSIWTRPERFYPSAAVSTGEFPGPFQDYVASILLSWQKTEKKIKELDENMKTLGLTSRVSAKQIADTRIEVSVDRAGHGKKNGSSDMVDIADVGVGVSRSLPVLVALLTAHNGQIVYLEEPEAHLHPRAQVAMARVLADAAARGVTVIAETHSSLLVTGIQTLVASGKLDASIVKLHWFERDSQGFTKVASDDLDDGGRFGEWPADFDDVTLNTEANYLDAVARARKR